MLSLPRIFSWSSKSSGKCLIDLRPVEVHDVEKIPDKRARAVKHLIRVNHTNNALIYHNLEFHNHMVHVLGSSYILGATVDQLQHVYDAEQKELEPWKDAPGEVGGPDWWTFRGNREYQRAFVDFFEDQLVLHDYEWQALAQDFLFGREHKLITGLTGGLGHPLIHLAYAYELDNRQIGIESLAQIASNFDFTFEEEDMSEEASTKPLGSSPIALLKELQEDPRFDGLFSDEGGDNMSKLMQTKKQDVLEYIRRLSISKIHDGKALLKECFKLAIMLLCSTSSTAKNNDFDFFICHILTSLHGVRILLPLVPSQYQETLLRQWWYLVLKVYVAQLRPEISDSQIVSTDLEGRGWDFVVKQATEGEHSVDAHFVKALRAIKEADAVFTDNNSWFLKAGVRLASHFKEWSGFGN